MADQRINLFHVGPQKTGTTWLYNAASEHPEICAPESDSVHFFNMHYCKGLEWYQNHYKHPERKVLFDPTPSYLRDPLVPARIHQYNPDAKIILTVRNPIERAFSHYWHERKKDRFNFTFNEVLLNYDLFVNWVEPGLYATHISRFLEYFDKGQIKVLFFDDLKADPGIFLADFFRFAGIDETFVPSVLKLKINVARPRNSHWLRLLARTIGVNHYPRGVRSFLGKFRPSRNFEKLESQDMVLLESIAALFLSDIKNLEDLTTRDLSCWKTIV